MHFSNRRLYRSSVTAKRGRGRSPKLLRDLKAWIENKYSITVILLKYDAIKSSQSKRCPTLNIVVETDSDFEAINNDIFSLKRNVVTSVIRKFDKLIEQTNSSQYTTDSLHVCSHNFSSCVMHDATLSFLKTELDAVVETFSEYGLWTMHVPSRDLTAFFHTDEQVNQAKSNGCLELLTAECLKRIARYDEFHYFEQQGLKLHLDSKENLDTNYEGSWFYYFR